MLLILVLILSLNPIRSSSADAATRVDTYESPCYHRERVARGIPAYSVHENRGLMAYVRAHLHGSVADGQLADYWRALAACNRNEPVSRWAWGSMVLVRIDYIS